MSYLIVIIFLALTFILIVYVSEDCYKSVDEFHSNAFRIPFYTSIAEQGRTSALSP